MKARLPIGVIIILLTLVGVVLQQPTSMPNQEIVLQFSEKVTHQEAQITVTKVKQQLQSLGVENIQVRSQEGNLKITYFSNTDVSIVKNSLSKEKELETEPSSNNQDQEFLGFASNYVSYNLDVYEIQDAKDFESGFEGTYVTELKSEADRLLKTNFQFQIYKSEVDNYNSFVNVAYKLNENIALAIDNSSRTIPEVRAGPIA